MKLTHPTTKLSLVIEEDVLNRLEAITVEHYPKEFGGFLMGRYLDNFRTLVIADFILPKVFSNSPVMFERSVNGIEDQFERFFTERELFYVGEWHSHPDGSTKSSRDDLKAMISAANCETVQIANPVLLILSSNQFKITGHAFYYFDGNYLSPYE